MAGQGGAVHHDDGVERRLAGSQRHVLQIAAVEWLGSHLPLVSPKAGQAIAALCIASVPLLGSAVEVLLDGDVGWFVWTTASIYCLLTVLMLLGAVNTWKRVVALGPGVDAMLDQRNRRRLSGWLGFALDWRPQVLALIFGIGTSMWAGIQLSHQLSDYAGSASFAYNLTITWTGGIGAMTVYWLWGSPTLLFTLSSVKDPELDWVAPLQTPAIQETSRLMIESSRLATIGLALFAIPIAVTVALASTHGSVLALSIASVVFSITTVLGCSFLPQIALENLVRRGKEHTLKMLRPKLPSFSELVENPTPEAVARVELYQRLAASPVVVVDWKRMLEYTLLLSGSIVPIAIALASR